MRTTRANKMVGKDGNGATSQTVLCLGSWETILKDMGLAGGVAGSPNLTTYALTVILASVVL